MKIVCLIIFKIFLKEKYYLIYCVDSWRYKVFSFLMIVFFDLWFFIILLVKCSKGIDVIFLSGF